MGLSTFSTRAYHIHVLVKDGLAISRFLGLAPKSFSRAASLVYTALAALASFHFEFAAVKFAEDLSCPDNRCWL